MMFNAFSFPPPPDPDPVATTRHKALTTLETVLESDTQLRAWIDRRRREQSVLQAVRRLLPRPVAERLQIVDGRGSKLELATGAGAIASVVRQHSPQILDALQRAGWQFSGIRVRVQPQFMPLSSEKGVRRQWDSASRRPILALEEKIPPGPLKTALGRLLKGR